MKRDVRCQGGRPNHRPSIRLGDSRKFLQRAGGGNAGPISEKIGGSRDGELGKRKNPFRGKGRCLYLRGGQRDPAPDVSVPFSSTEKGASAQESRSGREAPRGRSQSRGSPIAKMCCENPGSVKKE